MHLAGLLRVVARPVERSLDRLEETPREIGPLLDRLIGRDQRSGENLEAHLDERQRDDLLARRLGGLVDVIMVDRIERRGVDVLGDQLPGHGGRVHVHPNDLVRVGAGFLRHLGEIELVAVAGRDADLLAFEPLEVRDAGTLEHEQRVRRLGIEHRDGLDRHVLARPCGGHRRDIGDAEIERAARELRHRVARAVAARDGDVDALLGKDALLPAAVIHRVFARRQPIGLEAYLVGGGGRRGAGERRSREEGDKRQCTCWMLHEGTPAPGEVQGNPLYQTRSARWGELRNRDTRPATCAQAATARLRATAQRQGRKSARLRAVLNGGAAETPRPPRPRAATSPGTRGSIGRRRKPG